MRFFWKFFRLVFLVKIRQQFIGMAGLIASFCTIKRFQGFSKTILTTKNQDLSKNLIINHSKKFCENTKITKIPNSTD